MKVKFSTFKFTGKTITIIGKIAHTFIVDGQMFYIVSDQRPTTAECVKKAMADMGGYYGH